MQIRQYEVVDKQSGALSADRRKAHCDVLSVHRYGHTNRSWFWTATGDVYPTPYRCAGYYPLPSGYALKVDWRNWVEMAKLMPHVPPNWSKEYDVIVTVRSAGNRWKRQITILEHCKIRRARRASWSLHAWSAWVDRFASEAQQQSVYIIRQDSAPWHARAFIDTMNNHNFYHY